MAFAAQIRDPDNHKFTTPSGKIEVYSMAMAAKPDPYGLGVMPPIPTWFEPVEPDPRKYPLMLCSPKSRARTHSIHGNQPLLARVDPDDVWMHPADARARGITNGQTVRVFNDRGSTFLPVKVTPRIAPGVVSIKEGAWFTPDADGTDTAAAPTRWPRIARRRAARRPTTPIWSRSHRLNFLTGHVIAQPDDGSHCRCTRYAFFTAGPSRQRRLSSPP